MLIQLTQEAAFGGGGEVAAESLDTADAQAEAGAGGGSSGGNNTAVSNVNSNQNVNATTHNYTSGGSNPTGGRGNYIPIPGQSSANFLKKSKDSSSSDAATSGCTAAGASGISAGGSACRLLSAVVEGAAPSRPNTLLSFVCSSS